MYLINNLRRNICIKKKNHQNTLKKSCKLEDIIDIRINIKSILCK